MEITKVNCINDKLAKYDYLAKDDDFIQVIEWSNGEGYNITINDKEYSLTHGQLEAINYLIRTLEYNGETLCQSK